MNGLTTLAYFSIGVNADGTLDESGPGWAGYESQDLTDLVTRAHEAGDRVVLTVNCFDQGALDQLTSIRRHRPPCPPRLVSAVSAKNLDGVNLDFEGEGSADQAGLTNLITTVSAALQGGQPPLAGDDGHLRQFGRRPQRLLQHHGAGPGGRRLLRHGVPAEPCRPPVLPVAADLGHVQRPRRRPTQYAAAAPPSKVILGLPFYGYDWPPPTAPWTRQATGARPR